MAATLHLSVINDGTTYDERLRVIRSQMSDAQKFHTFCKLVCRQADAEKAWFDVSYTLEDLSAATTEVFRYMERHLSEFTDN